MSWNHSRELVYDRGSMPHIHERVDFTVEVFIVYKNKVLLRKHDKYGIWLSVGGHVELHEDPNEAAVREVKEEIGLDIKLADGLLPFHMDTEEYCELIPPKFMNRHRISPHHEHISMTYFARAKTDKIKNEGGEESEECRWFTKEELQSKKFDIRDSIKVYALAALSELGSTEKN